MSAQNIFNINTSLVKDNMDKILMCFASKDLLRRKLGVSNVVTQGELQKVLFLHRFLDGHRSENELCESGMLEEINRLSIKYN